MIVGIKLCVVCARMDFIEVEKEDERYFVVCMAFLVGIVIGVVVLLDYL